MTDFIKKHHLLLNQIENTMLITALVLLFLMIALALAYIILMKERYAYTIRFIALICTLCFHFCLLYESRHAYNVVFSALTVSLFWIVLLPAIALIVTHMICTLSRIKSRKMAMAWTLGYIVLVALFGIAELILMFSAPMVVHLKLFSIAMLSIMPMLHYFVPLFFPLDDKHYRWLHIIMALSTLSYPLFLLANFTPTNENIVVDFHSVFYLLLITLLYSPLPIANLRAWLRYRRRQTTKEC